MKSIEFKKISFAYNQDKLVLSGFDLRLESGQDKGHCTAIMGPSGSGKSTLLKLLLGIEKPRNGKLFIDPENPVISYVPQEAVLFEHLSPKKNARYFQFAGAYKHRFDENLYHELVQSLGLTEVIKNAKSVTEISGGQKQRLSLLRALSINPDFILLDEPCNGLDAEVKRTFLNKLREITEHYGLFVMYITHHKLEAQLVADDVVYLVQDKTTGTVKQAAQGSIIEFMEKPPVLEAAYVFRFPDVKVLPMKPGANGGMVIAENENDITEHWLVEDTQIEFNNSDGFPFKVLSKSAVYTVIQNEEADVEWMVDSKLLEGHEVNSMLHVRVDDSILKYKLK